MANATIHAETDATTGLRYALPDLEIARGAEREIGFEGVVDQGRFRSRNLVERRRGGFDVSTRTVVSISHVWQSMSGDRRTAAAFDPPISYLADAFRGTIAAGAPVAGDGFATVPGGNRGHDRRVGRDDDRLLGTGGSDSRDGGCTTSWRTARATTSTASTCKATP